MIQGSKVLQVKPTECHQSGVIHTSTPYQQYECCFEFHHSWIFFALVQLNGTMLKINVPFACHLFSRVTEFTKRVVLPTISFIFYLE